MAEPMPWLSADVYFPSTFSYKLPTFSMSYAACAFIPSPSTVKLAITATVIAASKDIKKGEIVFEKIKVAPQRTGLPQRFSVFRSFIRRLKAKRFETGFDRTFGIREYTIYSGPLRMYVNPPHEIVDEVMLGLRLLRYLGSSDSLCYTLGEVKHGEEPPSSNTAAPHEADEPLRGEKIILQLTDFSEEATFAKVNLYNPREKPRLSRELKLVPYVFPVKVASRAGNYTVYELSPSK